MDINNLQKIKECKKILYSSSAYVHELFRWYLMNDICSQLPQGNVKMNIAVVLMKQNEVKRRVKVKVDEVVKVKITSFLLKVYCLFLLKKLYLCMCTLIKSSVFILIDIFLIDLFLHTTIIKFPAALISVSFIVRSCTCWVCMTESLHFK